MQPGPGRAAEVPDVLATTRTVADLGEIPVSQQFELVTMEATEMLHVGAGGSGAAHPHVLNHLP
jgi:hypothetical protein